MCHLLHVSLQLDIALLAFGIFQLIAVAAPMYVADLFSNKAVLVGKAINHRYDIGITFAVGQAVGQACGNLLLHLVKIFLEEQIGSINPSVCCSQCLLLQLVLEILLL